MAPAIFGRLLAKNPDFDVRGEPSAPPWPSHPLVGTDVDLEITGPPTLERDGGDDDVNGGDGDVDLEDDGGGGGGGGGGDGGDDGDGVAMLPPLAGGMVGMTTTSDTAAKGFAAVGIVTAKGLLRSSPIVRAGTLKVSRQMAHKVNNPPPSCPFAACTCVLFWGRRGGVGRERGAGRIIHHIFISRAE